jgi:methylated-DNA-[protein]-cysteine S-methyltransferase
MHATSVQLATRFGPFSCAVDADGAVLGTTFGPLTALRSRLPAGVELTADSTPASELVAQLEEYFSGTRRAFTAPIAARGTPFQEEVWAALRRIPWGETRTYGELAALIGKPGAARAVGRANATNPVCVLVPCHRVIGAGGQLTGFAFGPEIKRQLLALEGVSLA